MSLTNPIQNTLVLLKPDAYHRKYIGKIITRFEEKGFDIKEMRCQKVNKVILYQHYAEHQDKPFFQELIHFMMTDRIVSLVLSGFDSIRVTRQMIGETNPLRALAGTIRGDYGTFGRYNMVHASDGIESATRELVLWFPETFAHLPADQVVTMEY